MKIAPVVCLLAGACAAVAPGRAAGQYVAPVLMPKADLTLNSEVATTTDEGLPSSLRVTLTNAGDMPVSVPVFSEICGSDNIIDIHWEWTPATPIRRGSGGGLFCGDTVPLSTRVRRAWVKLRSGESIVNTINLLPRYANIGSGTVHYWVELNPPRATPTVLNYLWRDGFLIPTEKLRTKEAGFQIP